MKVVFIIYSYPPRELGGWQRFTQGLAEELWKLGNDVTVIVTRDGIKGVEVKEARGRKLKVIRIPEIKVRYVRYIVELFSGLILSVVELPDIIFGMSLSPGGIISSFLGKILKARDFMYIMGREFIEGPGFITKFAGGIFSRLARTILCATDFAKSTVPCFASKKCVVSPLYIDICGGLEGEDDKKEQEEGRRGVIRKGKKFIIMYAGRIIKEKGLDLLIEAISIIKMKKVVGKNGLERSEGRRGGEVFLKVVGAGEMEKKCRELASKLLDKGDYEFIGYVEKEELARHYMSADLLVVPSRSETFGLVILEANFYGIPVVATNVMGIPSIVKNNENGILVEPRAEAIAEGIEKLISDGELYKKISEKGRQVSKGYVKRRVFARLGKIIGIRGF